MVGESEIVGVQFERAPGSWAAAHRSHPDPCYCLTLGISKGSELTFISHSSYQG